MEGLGRQNNLEKTIAAGIHGTPELRPDEKRRYLGFFRERVIQAVTFKQIKTKAGLEAMKKALEDPRGIELLVHQDVRGVAMPLIVLARRQGLDFTLVSNPKFKGGVAVALVAKDAVDIPQVMSERE